MTKEDILKQIKGKLIVSCQALEGEPLYIKDTSIMYLMARAAKKGGACAIRTNGVHDVKAIKKETHLPIIGLIKKSYKGYEQYITFTMDEVDELVEAGAEIIAIDCTLRKRINNQSIEEFVVQIRKKHKNIIIMADISNFEEGVNAFAAGVDMIGTTLSGYTSYTQESDEPDYELVKNLSKVINIPIIAEGRIHYPSQAAKMLELGAYAVVVGGAITRPLEITQRFVSTMEMGK